MITKIFSIIIIIIIITIFNFAHTNNYNTLHLQFITGNCYRSQKRNKRKKKDKVHKNTIVYILTIKRRLPALGSSINIPTIIIPTLKDNLNFNLTKLAKNLQE